MDFVTPDLNIANLKRKMDTRGLTLSIAAENVYKEGRFYILWRDGNFITIQAEPWWRAGVVLDPDVPSRYYLEERQALWHLQEVIQTILDTIVFNGENNWAHLVRLKNGTYRLVYTKRQLSLNCPVWTKVVELDGIEITRFVCGECWEGIYEGEEVDIFIGWRDIWGEYVSSESRGQKLVESHGLGRYFFQLKAHVYKNGVLVGFMMEALVGLPVTLSDRPAVLEAIADIQRHGICIWVGLADIYITERGVRFACASTARYHQDRDALAESASYTWETLAKAFNNLVGSFPKQCMQGSRSLVSTALIIPRLPSPSRPIKLTPNETIARWLWSLSTSPERSRIGSSSFRKLHEFYYGNLDDSEHPPTRHGRRIKGDRGVRLSPYESSGDLDGSSVTINESLDGPLVARRHTLARYHPYGRPSSQKLLLPREFDAAPPATLSN